MSDAEKVYFHRRAEEELIRAQQSLDPVVVHFHYQLAGLYLDRVFGQPPPSAQQR